MSALATGSHSLPHFGRVARTVERAPLNKEKSTTIVESVSQRINARFSKSILWDLPISLLAQSQQPSSTLSTP